MLQTDAREGRALWIIWGAMLWCVVLYGIVGLFLRRSAAGAGAPSAAMPGLVLPVAALLIGAGSWVVRAQLARQGDYRRYCIVSWAMAEAVALTGLVFAINGGALGLFSAFLGAAVLLLAWYRPSGADRDEFAARRGQGVSR